MPTLCSQPHCNKTSGTCKGCASADAWLTPERVDEIHDTAAEEWSEDEASAPFTTFFARAISREVVGLLAADQPEIDYDKLIEDAYANHKYHRGTRACIAFKCGAEWYRSQLATPGASGAGQEG